MDDKAALSYSYLCLIEAKPDVSHPGIDLASVWQTVSD
jgi:hypothetical protein